MLDFCLNQNSFNQKEVASAKYTFIINVWVDYIDDKVLRKKCLNRNYLLSPSISPKHSKNTIFEAHNDGLIVEKKIKRTQKLRSMFKLKMFLPTMCIGKIIFYQILKSVER